MKYRRADLDRVFGDALSDQSEDKKYLEQWAATYNLLRTVPDDSRFKMDYWGIPSSRSKCGTSACAAGHDMLHPWFRKRGILKDACKINGEELLFRNYAWFGTSFDCPFNPEIGWEALGLQARGEFNHEGDWIGPDRITPKAEAEVVMAWMLRTWPKEAVAAAVKKTSDVKYDMEAVHRFTPWNNKRAKQLNTLNW